MTTEIDDLDVRLVELLAEEPRIGQAELARRLGVARGTAGARLQRLRDRGVVRGFGPDVEPRSLGYAITAFVSLQITQGRLAEAVAVLEAVPEVLEADATSGPSDLVCRVVARDTEHLQEIVNRLLGNPAIRRSTSTIVLSRQIPYRTGPLVRAAAQA